MLRVHAEACMQILRGELIDILMSLNWIPEYFEWLLVTWRSQKRHAFPALILEGLTRSISLGLVIIILLMFLDESH